MLYFNLLTAISFAVSTVLVGFVGKKSLLGEFCKSNHTVYSTYFTLTQTHHKKEHVSERRRGWHVKHAGVSPSIYLKFNQTLRALLNVYCYKS